MGLGMSKSASHTLETDNPVGVNAPPPKWLWITGVVLAVVGVIAFTVQFANQSMAGSSQYPWGLYIALFYTAASAGAGLLVVVGIVQWAGLAQGMRIGALYAAACSLFFVASVLIVVDLGNPLAIMLTYASANPASPVFFDALALPLCIVFSFVAALMANKNRAPKILAVVGIVAGFVLLGIEAWLLTTCSGRDAWGVLLGAGPAFLQAVVLALAVVVLGTPQSRVWRPLLAGMSLIMVASLVFDVVLNQGGGTVLAQQFAAIAASPLFWIAALAVIAGVAVLACSESAVAVRCAAICIIVAVPLFKVAIFQATQSIVPLTELEGAGVFPFSAMEVVVFVGAMGFGVLAYAAIHFVLAVRQRNVSTHTAASTMKSALNEKEV